MELEGHLTGMLDRDQRTAKNSVVKNSCISPLDSCYQCLKGEFLLLHNVESSRTKCINHAHSGVVHGRTSPSTCIRVVNKKNRGRNNSAWFEIHKRLHRSLILGFYLILVSFPLSISAAPGHKRSIRMNEKLEEWMIPCGIERRTPVPSHQRTTTDAELLSQIIDQTRRTYKKADEFKEKFARKTFKTNWDSFHNMSNYDSFQWLMDSEKIPKILGESLKQDHLESLTLDDTLYNTYEYLQRVAIGLDQIVADESKRSGSISLKDNFEDLEKYILSVLCEIQTAMIERGLPKKADVSRDILPDTSKNGDNTTMNIRNYVILRDCLNILEYVIQCFEHLKREV